MCKTMVEHNKMHPWPHRQNVGETEKIFKSWSEFPMGKRECIQIW